MPALSLSKDRGAIVVLPLMREIAILRIQMRLQWTSNRDDEPFPRLPCGEPDLAVLQVDLIPRERG